MSCARKKGSKKTFFFLLLRDGDYGLHHIAIGWLVSRRRSTPIKLINPEQ